MTPALRSAAMRAILMFDHCEGQSQLRQCPQTTTFEEKGEPKQIQTEVPLLTNLTLRAFLMFQLIVRDKITSKTVSTDHNF